MSQLSASAAIDTQTEGAVDTDVLDVEVDRKTSEALREALAEGLSSPYVDAQRAIPEAVRIFQSHMDPKVLALLERFVIDPGSVSALHFHGLPIDAELPVTPVDGLNVAGKSTFVSEGVLIGIGRILGHPYAFKDEKQGQLIHQVCPVAKSANALSNEGSLADFKMHVENSFSEHRPHHLLLLCLRGDRDHKAMTRIAAGKAIASRLSPEHLAVARSPEFRVMCPASFGHRVFSEPLAIFSGPRQFEELRMDLPEFSEALTDRANATYEAIQALMTEPGVVREVDLQPGQALVLTNRKISHGRTVFTPRYDGADRWLQRMYTISDPWPMRGNTDERLRII